VIRKLLFNGRWRKVDPYELVLVRKSWQNICRIGSRFNRLHDGKSITLEDLSQALHGLKWWGPLEVIDHQTWRISYKKTRKNPCAVHDIVLPSNPRMMRALGSDCSPNMKNLLQKDKKKILVQCMTLLCLLIHVYRSSLSVTVFTAVSIILIISD
jgi:hypothetical protein